MQHATQIKLVGTHRTHVLTGSTHARVTNNADANTSSKAAEAIGEARCEVRKPEVI